MMMTRGIGLLIGYVIGVTIDYFYVPIVSVLFPIIFFVIFSLLPNTPQHYLKKHQTHVRHTNTSQHIMKFNEINKNTFRKPKKH